MRKIILTMLIFFSTIPLFCQLKKISSSIVYRYYLQNLMIKEDSVVKEYKYPLIEVEYFEIKIDETFFDSTRNEFKLIGKVCFPGDTAQCSGLPGVGIYKGIIGDNNILKNMVMLSETDGYQNLGKAGTFDITFQLKKGESLMFYIPHFYLEVFELGKLTANNF